jgi:hypothetical protein
MTNTSYEVDCEVPESGISEDDLALVTAKIRSIVPEYVCVHNERFCLSCWLPHLVEELTSTEIPEE